MYNTWFSFLFILWWEFGCLLHSNNNSTRKTFLKCNRRMSSAIKTFLKCNRRMSSAINTLESLARRFLQKKFFFEGQIFFLDIQFIQNRLKILIPWHSKWSSKSQGSYSQILPRWMNGFMLGAWESCATGYVTCYFTQYFLTIITRL